METFKQFQQVLEEGGASGHMDHPFDLPQVNTGRDLLQVFQQAVQSIRETPPKVKTDGVNTSIKLITNERGEKEFALDRGSMKPIDLEGVTMDRLVDRFKPGHAIISLAEKVLRIFNNTLPTATEDLISIGMWDNPSLILNIDAIEGQTNVIQYDENLIVIHNVLKFYQATTRRRGTKHVEENYQVALESLITKFNVYAAPEGFKVMGDPDATFKEGLQVNLENVLVNTDFTIDDDTYSLSDWLKAVVNPQGFMVKTIEGKKIGAMSKKVYTHVLDGMPLDELVVPEHIDYAKSGAIFYHATRIMGDAVLESLTSDIGDLEMHEGIVINDPRISPNLFKITGSFIIDGMMSNFQR
tara:strand:- start:7630 stop:8694 length:1065 start_codon:yes stop_codon:yes gene_type:complete